MNGDLIPTSKNKRPDDYRQKEVIYDIKRFV